MLCATIPRDRIAANANQDLTGMDGLAMVKQSLDCFMILIIINWILINVNVCCFLLVSSNKAADNCVFLKVINFIKMVGLKEGQLLNVLVKV